MFRHDVAFKDTYRLSGKKSPESRGFLATFPVFELRLGGFFVGLQPANQHVNGTDLDPGFTMGSNVFVILAQPPAAAQPREGALHHPTDLHRHEARLIRGLAAYLDA